MLHHVKILDASDNVLSAIGAIAATTIANLPGSPTTGRVSAVTDGDAALAWGATAVNSGAGATKYLVWFNGAAWKIVGK